jgi:hypothetical protein
VGNPDVGDVIENLQLVGLVPDGSSEPPFVSTSMAELRGGDATLALVHVAAVWCGSCRAAANDVGAREQEILDAGGAVIELVHEGQSGAPPTESELRAWMGAHDIESVTVGPADDRTKAVFPEREYAYIVDLRSMTVVWRERGLYASPTIGAVGADAILERL